MKKIMMTFAAVLCCAMTTTVVNAQEAESPIKEGERLAKAADDAPQDWKKQYDAAKFYLNESNGTPDPKVAEKYANRALEIAQSQTEKRDTILGKSFELMSTLGMYNKNVDQIFIHKSIYLNYALLNNSISAYCALVTIKPCVCSDA